jgi:hypothetical protein
MKIMKQMVTSHLLSTEKIAFYEEGKERTKKDKAIVLRRVIGSL